MQVASRVYRPRHIVGAAASRVVGDELPGIGIGHTGANHLPLRGGGAIQIAHCPVPERAEGAPSRMVLLLSCNTGLAMMVLAARSCSRLQRLADGIPWLLRVTFPETNGPARASLCLAPRNIFRIALAA